MESIIQELQAFINLEVAVNPTIPGWLTSGMVNCHIRECRLKFETLCSIKRKLLLSLNDLDNILST